MGTRIVFPVKFELGPKFGAATPFGTCSEDTHSQPRKTGVQVTRAQSPPVLCLHIVLESSNLSST